MPNLITRFTAEVIEKSFDSTLPNNLNDEWLEIIEMALETIFEDEYEEDDSDNIQLIMLAILHILSAKDAESYSHEFSITEEELYKYFEDYRMEIALESMSRKTDIKANPATLKTIFSKRVVEFQHELI